MDLIAKGRQIDVTMLKNNLKHWFRFGHLRPEQGIALLVGLIPDDAYINAVLAWGRDKNNDENTLDEGIPLLSGNIIFSWPNIGYGEASTHDVNHSLENKALSSNESAVFINQANKRFWIVVKEYRDLLKYWDSDNDIHPTRTPLNYFAEWALSKKLQPEWLNFAIENQLYTSDFEIGMDNFAHTAKTPTLIFDKSSTTYPSELDIALRVWQEISTTEGKGKPKARVKAWLDVNEKWLSGEAKERIATVVNWDKTGGATRTD